MKKKIEREDLKTGETRLKSKITGEVFELILKRAGAGLTTSAALEYYLHNGNDEKPEGYWLNLTAIRQRWELAPQEPKAAPQDGKPMDDEEGKCEGCGVDLIDDERGICSYCAELDSEEDDSENAGMECPGCGYPLSRSGECTGNGCGLI